MDDWYDEGEDLVQTRSVGLADALTEEELAVLNICSTILPLLPSLASELQSRTELIRIQHEVEESELEEAKDLFDGIAPTEPNAKDPEASRTETGPSWPNTLTASTYSDICRRESIRLLTRSIYQCATEDNIDYSAQLAQIAAEITNEEEEIRSLEEFHEGWFETLFVALSTSSASTIPQIKPLTLECNQSLFNQVSSFLIDISQTLTPRAKVEETIESTKPSHYFYHLGVYCAVLWRYYTSERKLSNLSSVLSSFYSTLFATSKFSVVELQAFILRISGKYLLQAEAVRVHVKQESKGTNDSKQNNSSQKKVTSSPVVKKASKKKPPKRNTEDDEDDDFYEDYDEYY